MARQRETGLPEWAAQGALVAWTDTLGKVHVHRIGAGPHRSMTACGKNWIGRNYWKPDSKTPPTCTEGCA